MSPREFHALNKRREHWAEREDRRTATLQAFHYNINTPADAPKLSAEDFMGRRKKKPQPRYKGDDILERQLTGLFGVGPSRPKGTS